MTPRIRALIVDDEPLAREGLRMLLAKDPEIALVGESAGGAAAVNDIREQKPDLVFLDVQMPEVDGFAVVAAVAELPPPAIVFVTAYDQYAVRAFEVNALDYLLKPYPEERFHEALRRVKSRLRLERSTELSEKLLSALNGYREQTAYATRLSIRDVGRVVFLEVDEIDWIEAADYYVQIHAGPRAYLHRESMQSLEERLDPARFVRIHRRAIVNRTRIQELRTPGRRELHVVLKSGVSLPVARSHRDKF